MLGHRHSRWPSIKSTLGRLLVISRLPHYLGVVPADCALGVVLFSHVMSNCGVTLGGRQIPAPYIPDSRPASHNSVKQHPPNSGSSPRVWWDCCKCRGRATGPGPSQDIPRGSIFSGSFYFREICKDMNSRIVFVHGNLILILRISGSVHIL